MAGSATISPKAPAAASQNYASLRAQGIAVLQQVARDTWTDHNLHDPGITLLEAFCYAITEAGLKAGMDLRDLIESGKTVAPPEFYTAGQVLPVMPVTAADLRKVLIDHPLLRNAWVSHVDVIPRGRIDILMEFADDAINVFSFTETIVTAVSSYLVEFNFPHWDEPEVTPLHTDVALQNAVFDSGAWNPVDGSEAWFNRVLLDYQPAIGPLDTTPLWVLVHVITPIDDPATELPLILAAAGLHLLTLGDNSAADQTLLKRYHRRVISAREVTRHVARYLQDYRNIGEYFHEYRSARVQEVAFMATIDITAATHIEDLLANIFLEIDRMISPPYAFSSLEQLNGMSSDFIFDGPRLDHGFLTDTKSVFRPPPSQIYSSDILRIIFREGNPNGHDVSSRNAGDRTVISVRNLSLSNFLDGRSITRGARDCLRLVDSKRHVPRFSPEKCKVFLRREGIEVEYAHGRVLQLFAERKHAQQSGEAPGSADIPVPVGEVFSVAEYYPVQNDLPLIYGVGEAGLPDHATHERRARARQLKGYLLIAEQLLAGYVAQLEHLNRMFSSDVSMSTTVFQQPLYHLPGIADLLKAFDATATTWQDFIADHENKYITALTHQSETEDQFLDRRNRMMDHLLARLGEHMDELMHREVHNATRVPGAQTLTLPQLLEAQQQRKRAALRRMIVAKSELYRALPIIQQRRLQSFGSILWHDETLVTYQESTGGVTWTFHDAFGQPLLQYAAPAAGMREAERHAQLVSALATQSANYAVVADGAQQRLVISVHDNASVVGRSVQLFANVAAALAEIPVMAQTIRDVWVDHALSAFEHKLYHMLPVRSRTRRVLNHDLAEYFEILNDPGGGILNEKIFRLWSLPGFAGDQLLHSEGNFPGPTHAAAIVRAQQGIRELIRQGIDSAHFHLQGNAPALQIVLHDHTNTVIARSPSVFADERSATQEIARIVQHIYRHYSMEGFYLLEHALLFSGSGVQLVIPSAAQDPYSFQLSIIFPSGIIRDFVSGVRTPDVPKHYGDPEFRMYAERMVRQSCPAHVLPRMYWVDRAPEGAPLTGDEPCFDLFEQRYRAWIEAYFTDNVQPSAIGPLRDALIHTLNHIVAEAESTP